MTAALHLLAIQAACGFPGSDLTVFTSRMDSMRSHGLRTKHLSNVNNPWLIRRKRLARLHSSKGLQHFGNHCANSCLKTKISIKTTELSISPPKWRMTCAENLQHFLLIPTQLKDASD